MSEMLVPMMFTNGPKWLNRFYMSTMDDINLRVRWRSYCWSVGGPVITSIGAPLLNQIIKWTTRWGRFTWCDIGKGPMIFYGTNSAFLRKWPDKWIKCASGPVSTVVTNPVSSSSSIHHSPWPMTHDPWPWDLSTVASLALGCFQVQSSGGPLR